MDVRRDSQRRPRVGIRTTARRRPRRPTPVQTFLPYADFARSARSLDDRRLGKQRVEALQIVRALTRPVYGWQRHPAVRMWRGHEEALGCYAVAICREWCRRGHADTCAAKVLDDLAAAGVPTPPRSQATLRRAAALPPWLGDRALHASHRAALVRKDPVHYRPRFPDANPDLPYVWPVPLEPARPPAPAGDRPPSGAVDGG